jgi:hypothetical protein
MSLFSPRILFSLLTFLTALTVTIRAHAQLEVLQNAPIGRQEFCEQRKSPSNVIQLTSNPENLLAFKNKGGLLNKGVCWWHSLFQRSALYITVFRPELQKPNSEQAKKIVHSIASGKKVVEIPGYTNIREFSRDWESLIQAKLEEWQLVDGFLKFAWIRGLSGSASIEPKKLEKNIGSLIKLVDDTQDVQWLMLQMDGITSHSALLVDGINLEPSYSLFTIDSNYVGAVKEFEYMSGDPSIFDPRYTRFVPYLGRRSDLKRFKKAIARYCSPKPASDSDIVEDLNNNFE